MTENTAPKDTGERTEIHYLVSSQTVGKLVAMLLVMTIIFAAMLVNKSYFIAAIAFFGIPFYAWMLWGQLSRKGKVALTLTPSRMEGEALPAGVEGGVNWKDLESVQVTTLRREKYLSFGVRDFERMTKEMEPGAKRLWRYNRMAKRGDFAVEGQSLELSPEELLPQLEQRIREADPTKPHRYRKEKEDV